MLDDNKIIQAEKNVKSYFKEGLLKNKTPDENIINILIKNSQESIKVADFLDKNDMSSLWVIVCSYYAMYYMANAILCKMGYKVGDRISHKVTSDALIVYIRNKLEQKYLEDFEEAKEEALDVTKLKANDLIESFEFERIKRSKFQYNMTESVKTSKAKTSLDRSKRFLFEIEKLLLK
ncbi:MAG: hypothetical protein CVV28_03020 [Methanobacteriales archaeon HGW-Methanobacteriales-1]|jgi:uncharacterized protein (UPF0332 family)|nr:MAG: hypothetical protein CVV28_03020 [Methanobacteriales archaeon HGW-Methanobacteriales-1]